MVKLKKKSLRKKDKVDIDALEASGSTRHADKVASKSPRFADDDDDDEHLYKYLERARKLGLNPSSPEAVILLASTISEAQDEQLRVRPTENKVVFSEIQDFVSSLQLGEETQEINMEEAKDEGGGWSAVNDSRAEEEIVPLPDNEIIHEDEVAVGKGLSGALKLIQERGTLIGRNMDKKKSKLLVGIVGDDEAKETHQNKDESRTSSTSHSTQTYHTKLYHQKDIRIERTDEFGRTLTPKEAFRILSHKFHGKGPGKMKQEKRIKQFQEELRLKQMKSDDTTSLFVERMREAQAHLKTPYLVLSGHVQHNFLQIKRKPEPANSQVPKKRKP